jgi:hypothetical protein
MAVSKKILRHLLGVKLSKIELVEPTGAIAKCIYSVGTQGDPAELRFFPYLPEAETFFFDQVRKGDMGASPTEGMFSLLGARPRTARRL